MILINYTNILLERLNEKTRLVSWKNKIMRKKKDIF